MKSCTPLFALLICLALSSAQSTQQQFPIAGVAQDAATGKPLRHIRIVITPYDRPGSEITAITTGDDGKFGFVVPKGKYQLRGERPSLPPQTYGSRSLDNGLGVAIITGPEQQTDNLKLQIHAPAAISGKIIDEAGDPVENALVQLIRASVFGGRKIAALRSWKYTNDKGEYRFGSLGAGTYYLAVTGKPWYVGSGKPSLPGETTPNETSTSFAPVFYPNAHDASSAAPITLKAGQETLADFLLTPTAGFDINVRLDPGGESRAPLRLQLVGEGIQQTRLFERVLTVYGRSTRIPSVPPGRYILRVLTEKGQSFVASRTVDVSSSDVELSIELKSPPVVAGTVELEGAEKGALGRLSVMLHDEAANSSIVHSVAPDGSVKFPGVAPGKYRVHVGTEPGVFAKDLVIDTTPLHDTLLEVGPDGVQGIRIVAERGAGRLRGFVLRNGNPAPGILVVLAPEARTLDHIHYHGFMTDSDGSFDWEAIRPGEYRIFATEDVDFEYSNPVVVRADLSRGKLVRVELNKTTDETLELQ